VTDDDTAKQRLRIAIARHVFAHPDVADTPAGIVQFWLPASGFEDAIDVIDDVLDGLVAEGVLRRRRMPDGGVVYAATGSAGHNGFRERG
jgi:hypothetical protein